MATRATPTLLSLCYGNPPVTRGYPSQRASNAAHHKGHPHYDDVIMGEMASQITSLTIVYSTVYSDADQRKHQSSASLAFVRGIDRGPVKSPHKWPVTRKMSPFDDIMLVFMHTVGVLFWLVVFRCWSISPISSIVAVFQLR